MFAELIVGPQVNGRLQNQLEPANKPHGISPLNQEKSVAAFIQTMFRIWVVNDFYEKIYFITSPAEKNLFGRYFLSNKL